MQYTGIAFPFSFSTSGGVAKSTTTNEDITHILEAVAQLLSTSIGERENEEYGCDLYKVAFSNGDDTDLAEACMYVREAVMKFEPRVNVVDVNAYYESSEQSMIINLSLEYIKTGEIHAMNIVVEDNGGITWTN